MPRRAIQQLLRTQSSGACNDEMGCPHSRTILRSFYQFENQNSWSCAGNFKLVRNLHHASNTSLDFLSYRYSIAITLRNLSLIARICYGTTILMYRTSGRGERFGKRAFFRPLLVLDAHEVILIKLLLACASNTSSISYSTALKITSTCHIMLSSSIPYRSGCKSVKLLLNPL